MPEVRRSTTRASGRGEQSDALHERRTVSDRPARDHALKPHDSKDWTSPHSCFHSTIHGLTELSIFNNITMSELRTTVTEWLTTAPEPETEGVIEQWATQRQAASTHTGIFKAQQPSQIRKQWRDHCQGYGASQGTVNTGDEIVLFAIAYIYNCKVTVHKRDFSHHIAHPSTASKSLNLVLFDVQSDILSENWSHYCSTRPIEPTERAGLEEPRVGLTPHAISAAASPPLGTANSGAQSRAAHVPADFTLANGAPSHSRAPSDAAYVMGDFALAKGAAAQAHDGAAAPQNGAQPPRARPPHCPRRQVGAQAIARGTLNADVRGGVAAAEVIGPPVGLDADIQLRRYTQIAQRYQPRGRWTGTLEVFLRRSTHAAW
jgi:hypothetical protein